MTTTLTTTRWPNALILFLLARVIWSHRFGILMLMILNMYFHELANPGSDTLMECNLVWWSLTKQVVRGIMRNDEIPKLVEPYTYPLSQIMRRVGNATFAQEAPTPLRRSAWSMPRSFKIPWFTNPTTVWDLIFPNIDRAQVMKAQLNLTPEQFDICQRRITEVVGRETFSEFICPISKEIMSYPVVASDGTCYDALSLFCWIKYGHTRAQLQELTTIASPLTGMPINSKQFYPNNLLRAVITNLVEAYAKPT